MSGDSTGPSLAGEDRERLLRALAAGAGKFGGEASREARRRSPTRSKTGIEDMLAYRQLRLQRRIAEQAGIPDPFFLCHDGIARDTTRIGGEEYLNFSTYDYLGLNGHPEVAAAAEAALLEFGSSAGASRLVSGERPPHRALERAVARFLGQEACLAYVSGHATNVTVLSHLFGARDLILHDSLSHNSLVLGAAHSGAARHVFPHNDIAALDAHLTAHRGRYERAIIVTEGLFSMDGLIARLPELVELKRRHDCFLMVDEAHSLGVLGATGRGVAEHFGLAAAEAIDIQMGTLSKTLCGCGGFIAGAAPLIELLKYTSPGFVYSVGISPPLAAASAAALGVLEKEPERVAHLAARGRHFVRAARARGLDIGETAGFGIVPVLIGNSMAAAYLAGAMFARKVNVMPIIHPVVEEGAARLRFFLSALHRDGQIDQALDLLADELPKARENAESFIR